MEVDMDKLLLIEEVHKRPAIWKRRHADYHNRNCRDQLWAEIAAIVDLPSKEAQKRWKNLKDSFRKEYKKFKACPPDMEFEPTSPYYHHISFIKDQLITRKRPTGVHRYSGQKPKTRPSGQPPDKVYISTKRPSTTVAQPMLLPKKSEPVTFAVIATPPVSAPSFHPVVVRVDGVKRQVPERRDEAEEPGPARTVSAGCQTTDDSSKSQLEAADSRAETAEQMCEVRDSDDFHFFLSLIPHVKNFSTIRKLRLRNKIQQLILEEAYDMAGDSAPPEVSKLH